MNDAKNSELYSAAGIEKYWQGKLSRKEMHDLEKAAMEDPFLADALEGYQHSRSASADLAELKQRLADAVSPGKIIPLAGSRSLSWWKIAAAIVLIGGAGWLTLRLTNNERANEVAYKPAQSNKQNKNEDTASSVTADSANTENPGEENHSKSLVSTDKKVTDEDELADKSSALNSPSPQRTKTRDAELLTVRPGAVETGNVQNGMVKTGSLPRVMTADTILRGQKAEEQERQANAAQAFALKEDGDIDSYSYRNTEANKKKASAKRAKEKPLSFYGRVVDNDNNPIGFANVLNIGNETTVVTNQEGYFTIPVDTDSLILLDVSSRGFAAREFRLNRFSKTSNNLVLFENSGDGTGELSIHAELSDTRSGMTENNLAPSPELGWALFNQYLEYNLTLKKEFLVRGEVLIQFTIGNSGKPLNITVIRSLSDENDREAIRLIKQGPAWINPGKLREIRLSVIFN